MKTYRNAASVCAETLQCNCDLDNWEPEKHTGHSWVCRIHKAAILMEADPWPAEPVKASSSSKGIEGQAFKGSASSPPSTAQIPVVEYIDCTPTWEGILPLWFHIIEMQGVTNIVKAEFLNMARAADRWNQHCKEIKGE